MLVKLALTGKPKSGKTTAVLKLVDSLLKNGIKVGGFYTVEVKKNDKRIGFDTPLYCIVKFPNFIILDSIMN